jgi:hypothetical protein
MISDKSILEKTAQNNYENVRANHSIKNGVHDWLNALATIDVVPSGEKGSYEEILIKV